MEISCIPYIAGGVLFGLIFGEFIQPIRALHAITGILAKTKRSGRGALSQTVDDSTIIRCGACQSVIMSRPLMRTVTSGQDTLVYQCHQCGTQVYVKTY